MADEEHLRILRQGVEVWNQWRVTNSTNPDLRGADLSGANLNGANLSEANLTETNLRNANLTTANMSRANLSRAILNHADLRMSDLTEANLSKAGLVGAYLANADLHTASLFEAYIVGAHLGKANLSGTDLTGANLRMSNLSVTNLSLANLTEANLTRTLMVETKIDRAILKNCRIYGISAWRLEGIPAIQSNLIITHPDEPIITVDNLEVAPFIYLLLNNPKIRDVIDTIAKKAVLILGKFSRTQKPVLEAIRDELKNHGYLPILFDWDKPASRDLVETVSTLAHLSRFVIADITYAKSIPAELMSIVPSLPSVAVQPLMLSSDYEYALFDHIKRYPWVLDVYLYDSQEMLLANFKDHVIDPAEAKAKELIPAAANQ